MCVDSVVKVVGAALTLRHGWPSTLGAACAAVAAARYQACPVLLLAGRACCSAVAACCLEDGMPARWLTDRAAGSGGGREECFTVYD